MKLVFEEPGSDLATELWDGAHHAVSSQLIYPEARAAAAAAHRSGRVDNSTLRAAVTRIDALYEQLTTIRLDDALVHEAGALAELHRLRGYDAVHLASMLSIDPRPLLSTWDSDLARAAVEAGCSVAPPPPER